MLNGETYGNFGLIARLRRRLDISPQRGKQSLDGESGGRTRNVGQDRRGAEDLLEHGKKP
jgi:hypothetical protein